MAKMSLPQVNLTPATVAPATAAQPEQSAAVVVMSEPPPPPTVGEVVTTDGFRPPELASVEVAATPTAASGEVAASTQPEALTVDASTHLYRRIDDLTSQQLQHHSDLKESLRRSVDRVDSAADAVVRHFNSLRADVASKLSVIDRMSARLDAADAALTELRQRIDALDSTLATRGMPTSTQARPPRLVLKRCDPSRRYAADPKLEGGSVVIPYNPRNGLSGADTTELKLTKDQARSVFTGFAVVVPEGYVCDVSVEGQVVASFSGSGNELIVQARSRDTYRHIPPGAEFARLTLRRGEPIDLVVES